MNKQASWTNTLTPDAWLHSVCGLTSWSAWASRSVEKDSRSTSVTPLFIWNNTFTHTVTSGIFFKLHSLLLCSCQITDFKWPPSGTSHSRSVQFQSWRSWWGCLCRPAPAVWCPVGPPARSQTLWTNPCCTVDKRNRQYKFYIPIVPVKRINQSKVTDAPSTGCEDGDKQE